MNPWIAADNAWGLWAVIMAGVAICIHLEQRRRWAGKVSGPVLVLVLGMVLSNFGLMPVAAPTYDVVDDYLVPLAIPLLLFRANLKRIVKETGRMFLAFHVAVAGTVVGAFLAAWAFRGKVDRLPEVTGIMTGSYTGGGVNFVAVKNSLEVPSELANPLLVADNFIMAGIFALLLVLAGSRFFLRHYRHAHSLGAERADPAALAAEHWRRKEISLRDMALALAVAWVISALSMGLADMVKERLEAPLLVALLGNVFVLMTLFTVTMVSVAHAWTERIHGAEELGALMLYLFFFVIGLRADLWAVLTNLPILFLFCLMMALVNLLFTLGIGWFLKLDLEELLLSVNATLGGAPTAVAMAIAKGWSGLILPSLLVGIWGYVIGTFLGVLVAAFLK